MNDDQFLLANAYLDGELTADERRNAEADPAVMAEVEGLRALQAELRAVPAPSAAARESAISAAMAEFAASSAAEPAPVPAPIPFRPRPAYAKYLGIAAAIVAVAGLGVIVSLANLGGGDDDAADNAAEATIEEVARDSAFLESVDTADAADEGADGGAVAAAEAAPAADDAGGEEIAADMVEAESAGDEATAEAADEMTADGGVAGTQAPTSLGEFRTLPPDFDPTTPITNEDELGLYGVYLLGERDAGRLPSTPNTDCPAELGEILDERTYELDGDPVTVYVAVVEDRGLVLALDTDTCAEVAAGSLAGN
jgi:hypothetical protein